MITQATTQGAQPVAPIPPVPAVEQTIEQTVRQQVQQSVESSLETAIQQLEGAPRTRANERAREKLQDALARLRNESKARFEGAGPVIAQGPFDPANMIPPQAVDIAVAFFFTIAVIAIGVPIARAFARRMDRRSQASTPPELTPRLDRMEQAIEAVAIEVERISEGQRFVTRLLSEGRALPAPNAGGSWQEREPEPARAAPERGRA